MTHAWSRTLFGGTVYNLPSRFLEEGSDHFDTIDFNQIAEANDNSEINGSVGQKVEHQKYGIGVITEVQGNEITVEFKDEVGTKYLDVEWAPIKFL